MDEESATSENKEIQPAAPKKSSLAKSMFGAVQTYFFQFFMLFLAITAGFFAENLREDFGERKQSREYANSMVNDLVRDTLNIQYHISRLNLAIQSISDLANYVRDKNVNQLSNLELYRLSQIAPNPPFRWSRATLEQVKSSGSLRYFTNDSIIYYISQYDAVTLHLDQDNFWDQQKYSQATVMRSQVVDMNYTEEFKVHLKSNPDSVVRASAFSAQSKKLLTGDINEVNKMVNDYLVAKDYSASRIKELSHLNHDQSRLILLLKREYDLQ